MTKEEFEQLKSTVKQWLFHTGSLDPTNYANELKLKFIEPKEKRIEELERENAERERQEKCDDIHLRTIAELDKENVELKEKLAGAERTRDNLRQLGFPTFQSCKEYADKMNYAKVIIKGLLDNSDEYARQRAYDFLKKEGENE